MRISNVFTSQLALSIAVRNSHKENKKTHENKNKNQLLKPEAKLNLTLIVQELCESRGGRPGLSVLTSLLVSVDVKIY